MPLNSCVLRVYGGMPWGIMHRHFTAQEKIETEETMLYQFPVGTGNSVHPLQVCMLGLFITNIVHRCFLQFLTRYSHQSKFSNTQKQFLWILDFSTIIYIQILSGTVSRISNMHKILITSTVINRVNTK